MNRSKTRAAATARRRIAFMHDRGTLQDNLEESARVFVYFNLHRKVWSIKALSGPDAGRVIGHATTIALRACTFKVSAAGRARVIAEGRKNVHAGVVGELLAVGNGTGPLSPAFLDSCGMLPVTYNPYRFDSFVENVTDKHLPVREAAGVFMVGRSVFADGVVA